MAGDHALAHRRETDLGDILEIAVVGGGIGGLAVANALLRANVEVTVHEQAPALTEVGAGVLVTPNSIRHLYRMGLGEKFTAAGARIGDGSRYCRADGSVVGPIRTSDSTGEFGVYGMHRADLLEVLADGLPPGTVHTDRRCVGLEQAGDRACVAFADGAVVEADAVVAADGIQSVLQRHVLDAAPPVHSGHVAYRGIVPASAVPGWPTDAHIVWMGARHHFMVYPVRGGELLGYVGFLPVDPDVADTAWSGPGDMQVLRSTFEAWDPLISTLLAQVDETRWWGLYDREPLERWTNQRLTLLGDAAHPMLPHLGQGVNQTIEDGVALATLLRGCGPAQVPQAFLTYESLRKPRTSAVQAAARANGRRYDSLYSDLGQRDAEISDAGRLRTWLYDHDVEKEAVDVLAG